MTLFIQTDTGDSGGSGDDIFPANATADLVQISNNDPSYGEADPVGNLIQVTYARTTSGPCPERLDTLVNTDFGVNADGIDIIILAVGSGFTLLDGTMMAGNGTAREPNTGGNPTDSVLVFYDVEDNFGDGVCLRGLDSGEYDLPQTIAVMLYHELSHAFHEATDGLLSLDEPDPCGDASDEERRAMNDENDMRAQLNLPLRDSSNHCGNPGVDGSCSTSCCVVATVATGSPYSKEVNVLRRVRDGVLRRHEIGYDFFQHLHDDYYGFSPEVCRMMARSPALLEIIRDEYVRPLTFSLELIGAYTLGGVAPEALGRRLSDEVERIPPLVQWNPAVLTETSTDGRIERGALVELKQLLDERARRSAFVTWALFEPIVMLADAIGRIRDGASAVDVGHTLASAIDRWSVALPLTDVWHRLSRYALVEELSFLGRALFRGTEARAAFVDRIRAHLSTRGDVDQLFDEAWGTLREVRHDH